MDVNVHGVRRIKVSRIKKFGGVDPFFARDITIYTDKCKIEMAVFSKYEDNLKIQEDGD